MTPSRATSIEHSDLAAAEAVVHLALPEDVAEGVEMREGHPVRSNREEVERSGRRRSGMQHHMLHGLRIIERGLGRERLRKRDYLAGLGETRRRGAFLRCDEVERPALVILAPASPVADLLEDAFDFGRSQTWCHVTFSRDACPQCIFAPRAARDDGPLCGVVASRISARDVPIAWPTPSRVTGLTCGGSGTYGDGGHGARGVRLMPRDFAGAALAGFRNMKAA